MNFDSYDIEIENARTWNDEEIEIPEAPDSWSINDFDDLLSCGDAESCW